MRHGRGFRYLDADGRPLTGAQRQRAIDLVIPPAWEDVWICPWDNGHIQAVGTDAAGRRQYLYHQDFRAEQERAKHEHVLRAAACLPEVRVRTAGLLEQRGLTRDRVLACGVRLLDLGFFRVGGESYARDNGTYGLATMLRDHARCRGGEIGFTYEGKGGKEQCRALVDPAAYAVVRALLRRRDDGPRLFAYWERGAWHEVRSADLNETLRELAGLDITAKDFRTWHATVLAAVGLAVSAPAAEAPTARKRAVSRVVREVSGYLGNTPAVCRASYINPRLFELFEAGRTIAPDLEHLGEGGRFGLPATQGPVEEAVRRLLTS
ncbi:DNA topoisomerase IB [Streptomyces sp. MST-110588]|nr:DNA topoisomerase IB [Streptomyces sp. MST-110588]